MTDGRLMGIDPQLAKGKIVDDHAEVEESVLGFVYKYTLLDGTLKGSISQSNLLYIPFDLKHPFFQNHGILCARNNMADKRRSPSHALTYHQRVQAENIPSSGAPSSKVSTTQRTSGLLHLAVGNYHTSAYYPPATDSAG